MAFNRDLPSPGELAARYREIEDPVYLEQEASREIMFQRHLEQLHSFVVPPGRLLDVGCYTGVFLQLATAAGWNAVGSELSGWAARIARGRGFAIEEAAIEDLPFSAGEFSAVTLWDVLEHLADPVGAMNCVNRMLQPGGWLGFSTYLLDSAAAKLLGKRYPFLMDMHVVHFSKPTLARLLAQAGFSQPVYCTHPRTLRLGYLLSKAGHSLSFLDAPVRWIDRHPAWRDRMVPVPATGLVNVFCKKTETK